MKTLYYTFRTSKYLEDLKKKDLEVFVFGSLKEDFEIFKELVLKMNPARILGFAEIKGKSRIEGVAINKFGKTGKVNGIGEDLYKLHLPTQNHFQISRRPTSSFCNWTMYKIAEYIKQNKMKTEQVFVHFHNKDFPHIIHF